MQEPLGGLDVFNATQGQKPRNKRGDIMTSSSGHRDALRDYLQGQKLKWTSQREAILEVFLATEGHLTSEEVYRQVGSNCPGVGFSTVYRTLRLFVEAGVASQRNFRDGVTRYEVRQPHHDHLRARRGRAENGWPAGHDRTLAGRTATNPEPMEPDRRPSAALPGATDVERVVPA